MSKNEQTFVILQNGDLLTIYSDELVDFMAEGGDINIQRASHVEPYQHLRYWFADMSPVGGPKLGPFDTRAEALDAEVAWLNQNLPNIKRPEEVQI